MPSSGAPDDDTVTSATLEDEEGNEYRVDQDNAGGYANIDGGGEWPDPDTPPEPPAPGTDEAERARLEASRRPEGESFKAVLETDPERGGSKSTPD